MKRNIIERTKKATTVVLGESSAADDGVRFHL